MTIKDIEQRLSNIRGNVDFYLQVDAPEGESYLYFKSYDSLIKYVKKNYDSDLVHKENREKKILSVRIWRKD